MPLPGFAPMCRWKVHSIAEALARTGARLSDAAAVKAITDDLITLMSKRGSEDDIIEATADMDVAYLYRRARYEAETDRLFVFTCIGDMDRKRLMWRDLSSEVKEEFEGRGYSWSPIVRIPEQVHPGDTVILARICGRVSLLGYARDGGPAKPVYSDRVGRERLEAMLSFYKNNEA